ncbi:MAG: PcfJ domain-containing protein [Hymenobacter sp.]
MRQALAACTILEALRYAQLAVRGASDWFGIVLESRLAEPPRPMTSSGSAWWIFRRRAAGRPPAAWPGMRPDLPEAPRGYRGGARAAGLLAAGAQPGQRAGAHRRLAPPAGAPAPPAAGSGLPLTTEPGPACRCPTSRAGRRGACASGSSPRLASCGGRARVQHCVAPYVASCRRERCGIFALTLDHRPAVTLEVAPDRTVVQARGRHNRGMTAEEREWVQHWLQATRLAISKYV